MFRRSQGRARSVGGIVSQEELLLKIESLTSKIMDLTDLVAASGEEIALLTKRLDEEPAFSSEKVVVLNKRAFYREATRMARLASRHEFGICLIYVNVDRFREINNKFGRRGGDAVLEKIAQELRVLVRSSDIVGRLGADEFGALILHAQSAVTVGREKAAALVKFFADTPVSFLNEAIPVDLTTGVQGLEKSMWIDQMIELAGREAEKKRRAVALSAGGP